MKTHPEGYREETWTSAAGVLHREDGPAEVVYAPNGALVRENYYAYGESFRADGPADVYYDTETGAVKREIYRTGAKGNVYRTDGPAEIEYYPDGTVKTEMWVMERYQRRARWLGPSEMNYAPDGSVESTYYSTNGWAPCSLERLVLELRAKPEDELREIIHVSNYARFLAEHEPDRIVDAVGEGLLTEEGIRLYLEGTPAEWIRAYETAGARV